MHEFVKKGISMPEVDAWRFFIQSLLALSYVHSKGVIHRDMKSLNVFFDSKKDVKIGDFGIACSLTYNSEFARTIVGTPFYLSPELCDDKPYNEKSDIWALGGNEVRSMDIMLSLTTFLMCSHPCRQAAWSMGESTVMAMFIRKKEFKDLDMRLCAFYFLFKVIDYHLRTFATAENKFIVCMNRVQQCKGE